MGRKPENPLEPLFRPREKKAKKKQRPPLAVRLPAQMLEELDAIAEATGKARNAIVVTLLRFGLDAYYRSRGRSKRKHD